MIDPYAVLGISPSSSVEEAKKAYKTLVKKQHPDINKDAGSSEKIYELNEAISIIKNGNKSDSKRSEYSSNFYSNNSYNNRDININDQTINKNIDEKLEDIFNLFGKNKDFENCPDYKIIEIKSSEINNDIFRTTSLKHNEKNIPCKIRISKNDIQPNKILRFKVPYNGSFLSLKVKIVIV